MIKRVKDQLLNKNGEDSVFLAITTNCRLNNEYDNQKVNLLLFMNRWDGRIGFLGGRVDKGETLIAALKREVKEEINYQIPLNKNIDFICSHNIKDKNRNKNVHLFNLELSFEEVKDIMKNCINSIDFVNECNGLTLTHLQNYGNKGLNSFLKNNLVDSVLEETIILLKKFDKKLSNQLIKDFKVKEHSL